MTDKRKMITISETGNVLTLRSGDRLYTYDPDKRMGPALSTERAILSSVDTDAAHDDSPWFVFYVEDCAFPTFHAIRADSWETAYEVFIDQEAERGHYVIKREDLSPEDEAAWDAGTYEAPSYSSRGDPMQTECFNGFQVEFVSLVMADGKREADCYYHSGDARGCCTARCGKHSK
jgi:hypothetical protein